MNLVHNCTAIGTEYVEGVQSNHVEKDENGDIPTVVFLRAYCVDCGKHWFGVDSSWWIYLWSMIFGPDNVVKEVK